MEKITKSSWIEAPKFAHISPKLKVFAMKMGVDISVETESMGWFREFISFDVSGEKEKVYRFIKSVNATLSQCA